MLWGGSMFRRLALAFRRCVQPANLGSSWLAAAAKDDEGADEEALPACARAPTAVRDAAPPRLTCEPPIGRH